LFVCFVWYSFEIWNYEISADLIKLTKF